MKKILKKIPKISIVLGIIFFVLALIIIEYVTISGYLTCEKVGWKEMCGFEIVLINTPMLYIFQSFFGSLTIMILMGFVSSVFWGFIGVLFGIIFNLIKFLFKKIVYGDHITKFISLIIGLILLSIVFYFLAVQFL